MLSRGLIFILISLWLTACGGGGSGGSADGTQDPSVPIPVAAQLDAAADTGVSSADNITRINTPTFNGGGGVAGHAVTIYASGVAVADGVVASDGGWSVTTSLLADGSYSITARYTNTDGGQGGESAPLQSVVIDTLAPSSLEVISASVDGISGQAGAGETITLYDDSQALVATVVTNSLGQWLIAGGDIPANSSNEFVGQLRATDVAGNESDVTEVGPIDLSEPVAMLVTGRAMIGAVANAEVCASVYSNDWVFLGCTVTDEGGNFGFNLPAQDAPVRVQMIATVSTTMQCTAVNGCGTAAFGDAVEIELGTIMQTIIPGDQFAGDLAITPLTHMAASWASKMPGDLNNDVVALSLTRVANLFALPENFSAQIPVDMSNAAEVEKAEEDVLRHSLFAASLAQLAADSSLTAIQLNDQMALLFSLLGGQVWLQSGDIILDDVAANIDLDQYPQLQQWLAGIDWQAYPELLALADENNVIHYMGLDALVTAAEQLAAHTSINVEMSSLVSRWGDNYLTTLAGATGYDSADFSLVVNLLNRFEHYQALAADADAQLDPIERHLAWLYVDEDTRGQTVGMIKVLLEALQFSLQGSVCVPQRKNLQACNVEPPYADLKKISPFGSDYRVELRGSRHGQAVSINLPSVDIRDFLKQGTMTMPVTGTIGNSSSETTLNLNIDLDITDNDLSGFNALGNLEFADESKLNPLLDALLADLKVKVTLRGSGDIASTSTAIGSYSFADLNTALMFNRRTLSQPDTATGPMLTLKINSGSRTNPAGETLSAISTETALDLVVDDPFFLDVAYAVQPAGLPQMEVRFGGEAAGSSALVAVLANFIESNLDAEIPLEEVDFDALLAELDFSALTADGHASLIILDHDLGQQEYYFSVTENGVDIATLAGAEADVSIRFSGLAGYIYAADTLVSTINIGNADEGLVLSLVDNSQRFYASINNNAVLPYDSFLQFLTLLYESYQP